MNNLDSELSVRELGEQGLLKRLQAFCPAELVGDDAAVLTTQPDKSLVVTADVLVDGVHFSDRTTSPEDAGWRAAAANLSDLAAMGATPIGITVGLGVPGNLAIAWVERLYQGLTECLTQYNAVIVGGDVVRSPVTTVAITAFGQADPNQLIRRAAAQPRQAIVVTGVHGASRAGLELLLHAEQGTDLTPGDRAALIRAHQRPIPRLDVLPLLFSPLYPSISSIAGMDSSDGLADAVLQICRASGVGAWIDRCQIPIPAALSGWVGAEQAIKWALYGGEDFELVLCLPTDLAVKLVDQLEQSAMIGMTTTQPDVWLVDSSHTYPDERLSLEQGFQHFC
ncbi:thiamine-phosphate kinase [Phormidium sp. CLA17]|uniref:thiamine-phosphate kinase n=1 Tax=Leptolyngbya sp. Cla-17 TaxID=2803751 RepID=UPI0014921F79|nr:thiamine-phosphate kinase [Leptolyngbya sp. Cla-17]MBM0740752.1 thiamine-phosphate kinase [Leptolyngbya sp. Cla-17]